jgi:hypothetical protein
MITPQQEAELRDRVRLYFRSRHPSALDSQVDLLADKWLKAVGANRYYYMDNPHFADLRDSYAKSVEDAHPEAMSRLPTVDAVREHLITKFEEATGRPMGEIDRHALSVKLAGLDPESLLREAETSGMEFEARIVGEALPDGVNYTFKPTRLPGTPTPFAELDPIAKRNEIAKRLGRDPSTILVSELAKFSAAIEANEAGTNPAPASSRPSSTAPLPRVINGMRVDSAEFQSLKPQERIRLARAAQQGAK